MLATEGLQKIAGRLFQPALPRADIQRTVREYKTLYNEGTPSEERNRQASSLSRDYYNLATDFYEFGWGHSFHFAPGLFNESLEASMRRYEQYLALRLGLGRGDRVLDVGCGVGGPMRTIAHFSEAYVVGINNNSYQIERGRRHNRAHRMESRCEFVEGDFTKLPFGEGTFDAAYVIESTCHAANRQDVFAQVHRVLKSGGYFAGYEWCLKDGYDPADRRHRRIRLAIEKGNGLPDLVFTRDVDAMLRNAGFELLDGFDMAVRADPRSPWYKPLRADVSLRGFLHTRAGAWLTNQLVRLLEATRLAPRGTTEVHDLLRLSQHGLVAGGLAEIFTPMYFFLARKN